VLGTRDSGRHRRALTSKGSKQNVISPVCKTFITGKVKYSIGCSVGYLDRSKLPICESLQGWEIAHQRLRIQLLAKSPKLLVRLRSCDLCPLILNSSIASSAADSARPLQSSRDNVTFLCSIIVASNRIFSTWYNIRVVTVDIEYISLSTSEAPFEAAKHMEVKASTLWVRLTCDNAFSSKVSKYLNNSVGVQWWFAIAPLTVSVSE
jgi:hypothetical protein